MHDPAAPAGDGQRRSGAVKSALVLLPLAVVTLVAGGMAARDEWPMRYRLDCYCCCWLLLLLLLFAIPTYSYRRLRSTYSYGTGLLRRSGDQKPEPLGHPCSFELNVSPSGRVLKFGLPRRRHNPTTLPP